MSNINHILNEIGNLDVIICTYNRPEFVIQLVEQILKSIPVPNNIIVVDSSDCDNDWLIKNQKVIYIKSDRKSQPYQRYLGAKYSSAEIIVYFDDDLLILKENLFEVIKSGFKNKEIVGVSLGIQYDNGVHLKNSNYLPLPKENMTGKITWLGKTTGLPNKDMFVEYFPGPVMAFRKSVVPKLFDEYLFSIFEKGIAMGEDKVISMRSSKYGKLLYFGNSTYLYHPPIPSTYYTDDINFIAKTTFSRLWISKVFAEVRSKSKMLAYLYFCAYLIKQLLTSFNNLNKFKGNILACKLILKN